MPEFVSNTTTRIVINTTLLLGPLGGVGHYINHLIRRIALLDAQNDYTYFCGFFTKRPIVADRRLHRLKAELSRAPWVAKTLRETLFYLSRRRRSEFDLYFEPNCIPLDIKAKKVVTTVHDFSLKFYPEAHPKERIEYFAKHFERHIVRSDRIITDSRYIKSEAADIFALPAEKITPVHLGIDHQVFRPRTRESLARCRQNLGLPEQFILFVGTREPRKNLSRFLQAYLELPESLKREFKVVLVGARGWGEGISADVFQQVGDRIVVIDYVDTDTLACIYGMASLFVFPSLYEGFGLPPVEAMACGCPVVVSNAASLPEVCGDAGFYVEPKEVSSIAGGICKVLTDSDLKRDLVAKGLQRARLFDWDKTAKETLEIFSQVLACQ